MNSDRGQILILEDEPDVLELICDEVSELGYRPIKAKTLAEAYATINKSVPDMALLDVRINNDSGLEMCRHIKTQFCDRFIPVVLITGMVDAETRRAAYDSGADDLIPKPYDIDHLHLKIESMFRLKSLMLRLSLQNRDLRKLDELKRNFLALVSHELRTPLAKIAGLSDNLHAGVYGDLPDDAKNVVNRVMNEATHLNGMLSQILEISKAAVGEHQMTRSCVEMKEVVDLAIEDLSEGADRIAHQIADENYSIWLDANLMRDVFGHILGNSLKFSRGDIDVQYHKINSEIPTRYGSRHAPLGDRLVKGRGYLAVEIRDRGDGIKGDQLAQIFDKFYQVDSSSTRVQPGIGIGLSFVTKVIEMHAGLIEISSDEGIGTSLIILLPLDLRSERR